MKILLDTNVFISGIHWNGASAEVLRLWFEGEFQLFISNSILNEITRTLQNFKKPLSDEVIQKWKNLIIEKSTLIEPTTFVRIVSDPDDDKFIDLAIEAKADYIITQDNALLKIEKYNGTKIISPYEFLKIIRK